MTHPQPDAGAVAPSRYGFHCVLKDQSFDAAVNAVTVAHSMLTVWMALTWPWASPSNFLVMMA